LIALRVRGSILVGFWALQTEVRPAFRRIALRAALGITRSIGRGTVLDAAQANEFGIGWLGRLPLLAMSWFARQICAGKARGTAFQVGISALGRRAGAMGWPSHDGEPRFIDSGVTADSGRSLLREVPGAIIQSMTSKTAGAPMIQIGRSVGII
jgi:hypothetical protein